MPAPEPDDPVPGAGGDRCLPSMHS